MKNHGMKFPDIGSILKCVRVVYKIKLSGLHIRPHSTKGHYYWVYGMRSLTGVSASVLRHIALNVEEIWIYLK